MSTRASIYHHPIHPMFVVFPIGLWIFAFICYAVYVGTGVLSWRVASLYAMAGGIIGALMAAVPGLIDLLTLRRSRAWRTGVWHMLCNVTALVLFIIAAVIGWTAAGPAVATLVLSIVGLLVMSVGGWLGGSLVYRHGVGVEQKQRQEQKEKQEAEYQHV